jgi:thioredoxin reductase/NAD-dependent dihydropyrimidine dehydrogenase PreA subunit
VPTSTAPACSSKRATVSSAVSEAAWLWTVAGAAVLAVVAPYVVAFRRRQRRDRERKREAAQLGVDRPAAQFPYVDPARCIGCGACVAACPEGDVLGVVGGTATIINGLRCVGHGRCEEACPVGAIEVGLGDVRSRADMPQVDDWNETDTPGLFLAGEVRGLALVRNAIGQGRRVVERIASRRAAGGALPVGAVDVLVVGAGPAGLSAALACVERGLTHVVLEQETDLGGSLLHYPRRKMVLLQPVELPLHGTLSREEYQKEQFLELMEGLVERHALRVRFGEKARHIARATDGLFDVGSDAAAYRAAAVVLAVGRRGSPRKLGAAGEELPKVMYRLIDAESYRDQKLLVVGGGDSAVEAAIGLAQQPRNEVTLSYRREKLVRIKKKNEQRLAPLVAAGRVRPLFNSQVLEIAPDRVRLKVGAADLVIANDYVFVFAGGDPPFDFLKQCGVRFGGGPAAAPPPA